MLLTVEKLVYGGDGLARGPADEQGRRPAVFIPFVLAGETVEAEIVERKASLLRARATRIAAPSPQRVDPVCPYFLWCGGCHYQHAGYEHQLQLKAGILAETVRRLAKLEPPPIEVHASPPWHYRNRTRLKVRSRSETGVAEEAKDRHFALGYYRINSHELLPVEQCPISSPLINCAIGVLWELGRAGQVSDAVTEIELFANAEDDRLLVELTLPDGYWTRAARPSLAEFVKDLRRLLPEVIGVAAFRATPRGEPTREEVPEEFRKIFGADELLYRSGSYEFRVSAGSFFQTNRHLTANLMELVTAGRTGDAALDLYAGTGLFTAPLARQFGRVTAVEAAPFSVHDLRRNAPANVEALQQSTERYLAGLPGEAAFDLVVADPPRAGLGEHTAQLLAGLKTPRLTYVSCDPATLARDLKVLVAAGFRLEEMHLVDVFPQTFHLESVSQLRR